MKIFKKILGAFMTDNTQTTTSTNSKVEVIGTTNDNFTNSNPQVSAEIDYKQKYNELCKQVEMEKAEKQAVERKNKFISSGGDEKMFNYAPVEAYDDLNKFFKENPKFKNQTIDMPADENIPLDITKINNMQNNIKKNLANNPEIRKINPEVFQHTKE